MDNLALNQPVLLACPRGINYQVRQSGLHRRDYLTKNDTVGTPTVQERTTRN